MPEQLKAMSSIIASSTFVKGIEVDSVFQSAVLDERTFGNMLVVTGQAHDEPKARLGVGI